MKRAARIEVMDRVNLARFPQSDVNEISVFSWNLLAQSLSHKHLDWNTVRLPAFHRWLSRYSTCDILCFQEVELGPTFNNLADMLQEFGFDGVVQQRKKDKIETIPHLNATFFKAKRFKLAWSEHRSRALLTGLLLPDGREVGIANVHLQSLAKAGAQQDQRSQLTSAVSRLQLRNSRFVVVCGDFNSDLKIGSALHKLLIDAHLTKVPDYGPTCIGQALDHLWTCNSMRLKTVLGGTRLSNFDFLNLPNDDFPSDHLPVAAGFYVEARTSCIPLQVEPPIVSLDILQEWLELSKLAKRVSSKQEARELKKIEAAFLDTLCDEQSISLRKWRTAAEESAQFLLKQATEVALAAVMDAEANRVCQTFDPGGLAVFAGA